MTIYEFIDTNPWSDFDAEIFFDSEEKAKNFLPKYAIYRWEHLCSTEEKENFHNNLEEYMDSYLNYDWVEIIERTLNPQTPEDWAKTYFVKSENDIYI